MNLPVVTHIADLRQQVLAWRAAGESVGLVPTMGALHEGHLSLVRRAVEECRHTVVTIFVNPTQFGPGEDFARYPRRMEHDLEQLSDTGADLVFAPDGAEMYPAGFSTSVEVDEPARLWEGAIRPGHYRGVATIVLKLFNASPADRAYFGQKDYQQTVVVRRMVADLNVPIEIRVSPTVREPDGLALSSRNVYLGAEERDRALVLSRSVRRAADLAAAGERDARHVAEEMRKMIESTWGVNLDYAVVVDPDTLQEIDRIERTAVALVAARIGSTRLIDNAMIAAKTPPKPA